MKINRGSYTEELTGSGDIAFHHGVGARPQALRAPDRAASDTSDVPIEITEARHS